MTDYLEEALGFDREEEMDWGLEPGAFWAVRAGESGGAQGLPQDDRRRTPGESGGEDMEEAQREAAGRPWPRALTAEVPLDFQAEEAHLRAGGAAAIGQRPPRPEEKDVLSSREAIGTSLERAGPAEVFWQEAAAGEALPLWDTLKAAQRGTRFAQGERRAFSVILPESTAAEGLSVENLDRAVERDAWRYGGDFALR